MKKLLLLSFCLFELISCTKDKGIVPKADYREPYLGTYAVTRYYKYQVHSGVFLFEDTTQVTVKVTKFEGFSCDEGDNYIDVTSKVGIQLAPTYDVNATLVCGGVPYFMGDYMHPTLLAGGTLIYPEPLSCADGRFQSGGFFPGDSLYICESLNSPSAYSTIKWMGVKIQ